MSLNKYDRPSFMKLSTAVKRLQKLYGKDKINRQLVLDMLEVNGVQPYYSEYSNGDYYIANTDWCDIACYIADCPKGAPVDEIFNIGIESSEE